MRNVEGTPLDAKAIHCDLDTAVDYALSIFLITFGSQHMVKYQQNVIQLLGKFLGVGSLLAHCGMCFERAGEGRNYAAHSADNASACCKTFCTAASCKSGG